MCHQQQKCFVQCRFTKGPCIANQIFYATWEGKFVNFQSNEGKYVSFLCLKAGYLHNLTVWVRKCIYFILSNFFERQLYAMLSLYYEHVPEMFAARWELWECMYKLTVYLNWNAKQTKKKKGMFLSYQWVVCLYLSVAVWLFCLLYNLILLLPNNSLGEYNSTVSSSSSVL